MYKDGDYTVIKWENMQLLEGSVVIEYDLRSIAFIKIYDSRSVDRRDLEGAYLLEPYKVYVN